MNSTLWIRKALSTCLVAAVVAASSMVSLAGSGKLAGELLVTGKNINGDAPSVNVNGEVAKSGRSVFSNSTIATSENAGAIISIGQVGKVELAPKTSLVLSFDEKGISGNLISGKLTVLNASNSVDVKTASGETLKLNAGETAASTGKAQDDDATSDGGAAWLPWALIFGGAVAGIVVAAVVADNETELGGGSIVVSPNR